MLDDRHVRLQTLEVGSLILAAPLNFGISQLELKHLLDLRWGHELVRDVALDKRQPLFDGLNEHPQGLCTIAIVFAVRVAGNLADQQIGNDAFQYLDLQVRLDLAERRSAAFHEQLREFVNLKARKLNAVLVEAMPHRVARDNDKYNARMRVLAVVKQLLEGGHEGLRLVHHVKVPQHDNLGGID